MQPRGVGVAHYNECERQADAVGLEDHHDESEQNLASHGVDSWPAERV